MKSNLDVVLAHDSFTQYGGAERVVEAISELFPESEIYTLASDPVVLRHFPSKQFHNSFLNIFYKVIPKLQWWFPLAPAALKYLKIPPARIVLSSSSAFMKGLTKPKGSLHVDYCHTPTRFLWSDVVYAEGEVPKLLRWPMRIYLKWLRRWDLSAAKKVDYFIANSKEVQERIKKYYNRDSKLIYPYIDTHFWLNSKPKQDYFLVAGRITPYKGYDQIIKIFNDLGIRLHVVGEGRYMSYLKSIAKENIIFFGRVSDKELRNQYSGAQAFIYPQVEDFGLMPLEAASCGTPTIALAKAGSLETVIDNVTGKLIPNFDFATVQPLIKNWDSNQYSKESMRSHAERFSKEVFQDNITSYLTQISSNENSH